MRTIFLSVPSGHSAANLLRSQVFSTLLKTERRLKIVILSPLVYDSRFTSEFHHRGVSFEILHAYYPKFLEMAVYSILAEKFLLVSRLEGVRLQRDSVRLTRRGLGSKPLRAVKGLLSRLPIGRKVWFSVTRQHGLL